MTTNYQLVNIYNLHNLLTMSVPDEGYSRRMMCILNYSRKW